MNTMTQIQEKSEITNSVSPVPSFVNKVLKSPGQPQDAGINSFMEPHFGHDLNKIRVSSAQPGILQARLVLGQPGDRFEREADLVADQVMRFPVTGGGRSHSPTFRMVLSRYVELRMRVSGIHRRCKRTRTSMEQKRGVKKRRAVPNTSLQCCWKLMKLTVAKEHNREDSQPIPSHLRRERLMERNCNLKSSVVRRHGVLESSNEDRRAAWRRASLFRRQAELSLSRVSVMI